MLWLPTSNSSIAYDIPNFHMNTSYCKCFSKHELKCNEVITICVCWMLHCEGYGRCWWAQPSAAELPDQDACALRQDRWRQLHICRLMPNVMLQLTSIQTDPNNQSAAASKETNGAAKEAVQRSGEVLPGWNGIPQTSGMLSQSWCCDAVLP